MLSYILFATVMAAGVAIAGLCGFAAVTGRFQYWPPPEGRSWQHASAKALFRLFLYPLVALTVVAFEPLHGLRAFMQYGLGAAALLLGFGLAMAITLGMGWRNAFGEELGLKTKGWFAISRNPIYVATWIGLVGWALVANTWLVAVPLALWAGLYALAPFLEEPWLEARYGAAYRAYKAATPRFL